jgi:hypothetical protein
VAHEIYVAVLWWPNGSQGREITCRTCDRLLWQSPPDTPFDASPGFAAYVARRHRDEVKRAAAQE